MVRVFYGKKGAGKTKLLIETANKVADECAGDIVFIDDSNQLIYDLKHKVRFVNVSEFPVRGSEAFLGFLCGMISEDYDIDSIFIDGLTYIVKQELDLLESFFNDLKNISSRFNIKFYLSINGDPDTAPDFIKEFVA